MIFNEISFHDSKILKVTENLDGQIIDFFIDFPTDWENNIFEQKILRFENVTFYSLEEIPFVGLPTILDIINLEQTSHDYSALQDNFFVIRNKVKIETNSGSRIVEFSDCRML